MIRFLQGLTVTWMGAAASAPPGAAAFWCSLTGVSGMTGGGDIEELEE